MLTRAYLSRVLSILKKRLRFLFPVPQAAAGKVKLLHALRHQTGQRICTLLDPLHFCLGAKGMKELAFLLCTSVSGEEPLGPASNKKMTH